MSSRSSGTATTTKQRTLPQTPKKLSKPSSWRTKQPKPSYAPLPAARVILVSAVKLVWNYKLAFGSLAALYVVLSIVLVQGTSLSSNIVELKLILQAQQVNSILPQLGYLFGSVGSASSAVGGLYQTILLIIMSLAIIWALRQAGAKKAVSFKSALYEGMYPLIPVLIVLFFLSLQLLPISLGLFVYSSFIGGGIAVSGIEQLVIVIVAIALLLWSLYMLTATIFAIYIVTLPGMLPLKAYRSAKGLVYGRRLLLWRKLLYLPIVLTLAITLLILPFLLFLTPLAPWVFLVLASLALPLSHAYIYQLYREMIA